MTKFGIGERTSWEDFPEVIRNGDLGTLKSQTEYEAAKQGDDEAALNLVTNLLKDQTLQSVAQVIGSKTPLILPVVAVEESGRNKIPLAFAALLGNEFGLDLELNVVQSDKVSRTGAGIDHRLAFNPRFEGLVEEGRDYLIVDDTLSLGGTIASLRGYIEKRGGHVLAAVVMTAHESVLNIAVKPEMVVAINLKHGYRMNKFFEENFGYGIDKLTQGEAGHVKKSASVGSLRERISAARNEGILLLDDEKTEGEASTVI